ncbi:hypothetical protein BJ912DRAFT_997088 [Pholiota molesta]|nr:hypothetical protein BJ912DRAFT_997088 [Pholiota molesta]
MAQPLIYPLIPNADQTSYKRLVAESADKEGLVNGIWNSILNARFPTDSLTWTINPEYRTKFGFIDLLVLRNEIGSNPTRRVSTIIFEGKQSAGDNYEGILHQLVRYTQVSRASFVYLVGARGRTCRFWRFTKGSTLSAERMFLDKRGNVCFKDKGVPHQYDIVDDQVPIAHLLCWIINNPTPVPMH